MPLIIGETNQYFFGTKCNNILQSLSVMTIGGFNNNIGKRFIWSYVCDNGVFGFKNNSYWQRFTYLGSRRFYSIGRRSDRINNILGNILNSLFSKYISKEFISNEESQIAIEKLVFDQYELLFKDYKGYSISGVNTDLISPKMKSFMIEKEEELVNRIEDFKGYYKSLNKKNAKKKMDVEIFSIINLLDVK